MALFRYPGPASTGEQMEYDLSLERTSTPSPTPERQCSGKLKPWLISQVDSGLIDDLFWLDREKGVFKISWVHKSKENWTENNAVAKLSMKWAINKGKYREGVDEKNFPRWKQTLRAAFRATNIVELKEGQGYDCGENYKIYSFGSTDAPSSYSSAQRSPSNSPKSSFRVAQPPTNYQDPAVPDGIIPSVVTDYKSDNLPSDLGQIHSGDLWKMDDQSISLTAADDPDRYRNQEPMQMSFQ